MRSCGPPTRSVGPTDWSAGLLVGRTHLPGTAVSLVGGDPGLPMSHKRLICTLAFELFNVSGLSEFKAINLQ
jgi:hypothetical protein